MSYQIRFAKESDLDQLLDLCAAHAAFEKSEYSKEGKKEQLSRAFFTTNPAAFCLVVEMDSSLIGYATYMPQYSTWDASFYCYMDCLFMTSAARSKGIGTQLMKRIQAESKTLGCSHIQWQTPDFNTRAIQFYERIGAISKSKERFFLSH